jgi:ribosomal protein L11 methyltransferase
VTGLFESNIDTHAIEQRLTLAQAHWHILEDKDWEREWMQHYHPIQCAPNLWICPSWIAPPDPKAINLLLDPGLAFGTGTHPTTFLCLQWLASQSLEGITILDYGCGSGILGVAALLLGAEQALGVDIDPQALLASSDNAQRNGLAAERFPVYLPKQLPALQVQCLVANILAGPLVSLAQPLMQLLQSEGRLCLSGILDSQAETVMQAYSEWIVFDPVVPKEEWVRLTGVKRT